MSDGLISFIDEAFAAEEFDKADRARDFSLQLRNVVKQQYDNWLFKTQAMATLSIRTVNARLLQMDQEAEVADFQAEIRHNSIMLKAGLRLGIIEGTKVKHPTAA